MAADLRAALARRLADTRRGVVPVVVWCLAALTVAFLLGGRVMQREVVGVAEALRYEVSAAAPGRLDRVLVKPLQKVEAGEVVARLAGEELDAKLKTAGAAVAQLQAELAASRSRFAAGESPLNESYSQALRRFRMDEEQRRLDALSIGVAVETGEVDVERLALELERTERLFAQGLVAEAQRDNARLVHRQARVRLDENRALRAKYDEDRRAAETRRRTFERGRGSAEGVEPALLPLVRAIEVQNAKLDELRVAREQLTLRAPVAGQVTEVLAHAGQAVVAGESVVTVTESLPAEILAWLPETSRRHPKEKDLVRVTRRADTRRAAESVVTRVGASVQALPQQLWRDPRVPEYGVPVAIAATPALALVPGEVVFVRF